MGARGAFLLGTEPADAARCRSRCGAGRPLGGRHRAAPAASPPERGTVTMNPTPPVSLWPDRGALGPVTDLYQLTMMAGYLAHGMAEEPATFELFVRRLPPHRAYLVFAG